MQRGFLLSIYQYKKTMTIYYKFYDANRKEKVFTSPRIAIACEIATKEQFETDCHCLVPMDTKQTEVTKKFPDLKPNDHRAIAISLFIDSNKLIQQQK